jgi:transposase
LTDAQWELIEPLLPEPKRRKDNRGRPWASNRACLEGILWVLQTGAAWRFCQINTRPRPPAGVV